MEHSCGELSPLVDKALSLGASDAAALSSDRILVSEQLALKCIQPQCVHYGISFSCPPHVAGPAGFRKLIEDLPQALVVRLVVPASSLLTWERLEVGRVLHELVACLEREAHDLGYQGSQGFAGGSCKELFCQEHLACQQASGEGPCRHPDLARPSLSGFGVDVFKLVHTCGWPQQIGPEPDQAVNDTLSWVIGLVMIG